ncbi:unnamed protein product [Rotaria socialis]|uniref:HNH nuclease domain-containing protein n=2 Tax=Rotaria socialis TaxID=392032 RepID=A0A821QV54_9BILA|nr:unnamed protein product [Rotaria socialis]
MSYEEYTKEKILKPLNIDLTQSGFRLADVKNRDDLVYPGRTVRSVYGHRRLLYDYFTAESLPFVYMIYPSLLHISFFIFPTYPAGLLRMLAHDLSKFLRMLMNNGYPLLHSFSIIEIKKVVDDENICQYNPANTNNSFPPSIQFGLVWNWRIMDDSRRFICQRGTNLDSTHLMMINDKNTIEVIILSNGNRTLENQFSTKVYNTLANIQLMLFDCLESLFILVTDGVKEEKVAVHNNSVSNSLLCGIFKTNIVGLQCIDTRSNAESIFIGCVACQYAVTVEEHLIYRIIIEYKEKTSNVEPKLTESNDQVSSVPSTREKSLTPTNDINRAEFNQLVSTFDEKLKNLSTNFDNQLKDLTTNIDTKFNNLSNELNLLFELVQPTIGRAIDPCDVTARSQGSSGNSLPKQVINKFYNINENECMICGSCNDVVNAHIWPKHTHGEHLLSMFNLSNDGLNDPRNYLRLAKSLELAFDNKSLTIIIQNGQLVLYVLDDMLKKQRVSNTRYTFKDCHLWPLNFGNDNRPFFRILAAHCRNSFIDAFRLQKINYETYKWGYNSSIIMLNTSPDGNKAKIFDWLERNEKIIKKKEKS